MRKHLALAGLVAALAFFATWAQASSSYLTTFNTTYGTSGTALNSCNLCHTNIPATNAYGSSFAANGHNFANIQNLDSDGDGFTNIAEINARTFPGDVNSKPVVAPPPGPGPTPPPPGPMSKFSIGLFLNGTWYLDTNQNGSLEAGTDKTYALGQPGDIPVVGDWNGDGTRKIGVFRSGDWYVDYNGNGKWDGCGAPQDPTKDRCLPLGQPGDIPVVGDWNGDGVSKIGVFRNGDWYLDYNDSGSWEGCAASGVANPDVCMPLGQPGDVPVVGDWNGDSRTKIGVYRNGYWYLDMNGNGAWDGPSIDKAHSFALGLPGTVVPVTGDWTGTGVTKTGVYANGIWYVDATGSGVFQPGTASPYRFGIAGAIPITGN